ncbi:MAG: sulfite exporter TauE/SafE family protein [Promethearchaeota archaeon]
MDELTILLLTILILIGAAIAPMVGLGGGVVFVPTLMYIGGVAATDATRYSQLGILGVSIISTINHYRAKKCEIKLALLLEPITILGALIGAEINLDIDNVLLKSLFGLMLFIVGIRMYMKIRSSGIKTNHNTEDLMNNFSLGNYTYKQIVIGMVFSFFAGMMAALLGLGGGVLKVPILIFFFNLPASKAAGTSSTMIILTSSTAIVRYTLAGAYNKLGVVVAFLLILCGLTGSYIGTRYSTTKLKSKEIQALFAILIIFIGCFTVLDTILLRDLLVSD